MSVHKLKVDRPEKKVIDLKPPMDTDSWISPLLLVVVVVILFSVLSEIIEIARFAW